MKLRALLLSCVIVGVGGFASCDQQPHATADTLRSDAAPAAASNATLTATPNPIPPGRDGAGTTTVAWNTGGTAAGALYVYTEDGAENLFAAGGEGSKEVNWIQPGTNCEFRLYADVDRKTLLKTVKVSASKPQ